VIVKDAGNADVTGNYTITYADTTASTIKQAAFTMTANNATRTAKNLAEASGNGMSYSALAAGNTLSAAVACLPSYSGPSQGATRAGN